MPSAALPLLSDDHGGYTLIGRRADVDVYRGDIGRHVELAAVGVIDAEPQRALNTLLSRADPRVIATMVERWVGTAATADDFALSVRWTVDGVVGMRFAITDNRGVDTRARNWVDQIAGSWGFEPLDDGRRCRAIYHVHIELASAMPRWIILSRALDDVPAIVEHVRSIVTEP